MPKCDGRECMVYQSTVADRSRFAGEGLRVSRDYILTESGRRVNFRSFLDERFCITIPFAFRLGHEHVHRLGALQRAPQSLTFHLTREPDSARRSCGFFDEHRSRSLRPLFASPVETPVESSDPIYVAQFPFASPIGALAWSHTPRKTFLFARPGYFPSSLRINILALSP